MGTGALTRLLRVTLRSGRFVEETAAEGDARAAVTVGEKAEMTDAVKAVGQDVEKEAADEFVRLEAHDLLAVAAFAPVVLPSEGDMVVIDADEAAVGDGDTVRVSTEMARTWSGPPKGGLA